jgi:hypothetical protein
MNTNMTEYFLYSWRNDIYCMPPTLTYEPTLSHSLTTLQKELSHYFVVVGYDVVLLSFDVG